MAEQHDIYRGGNGLEAVYVPAKNDWMAGEPADVALDTPELREAAAMHVLNAIEEVPEANRGLISCNEGLYRMTSASGPRPANERVGYQLAGGSLLTALAAADVVGHDFYRDPDIDLLAPIDERIGYVAQFLHERGIVLATEEDCKVAAGFCAILGESQMFETHPSFRGVLQSVMPEDTYNARAAHLASQRTGFAIASGLYTGLRPKLVKEAVLQYNPNGIEMHLPSQVAPARDASPVVEDIAVYIDAKVDGALAPNTLYGNDLDIQALGISGCAIMQLGEVFADTGRGNPTRTLAINAMYRFAAASQGYLTSRVPTVLVREQR